MENNLKKFWREYIKSYDEVFSNLSPYKKLVEIHNNSLNYETKLFNPLPRRRRGRGQESHPKYFIIQSNNYLENSKNILESGAGSGILSLKLLNQGKKITAIDQNEFGLEILKKKYKGKNLKTKTLNLEKNSLPFSDNFFDGISCMLIIPFIKNYQFYLKENERVLNDEGVIIISGPSKEAQDFETISKKWKKELEDRELFEKLKDSWDIVFKKTKENIKNYVHNWFSGEELKNILEEQTNIKVEKILDNPLYYGRGYVIIGRKNKI